MKRSLYIGSGFLVILIAIGIAAGIFTRKAAVEAAAGVMAPRFEVDPLWPKPLPNHRITGNVIGVSVDAQDHIWIVHRGGTLEPMETYAQQTPKGGDCCIALPPVLEICRGRQSDWPLGRARKGV